MNTLNNLKNGNRVTQRNAFLLIFAVIVIAGVILAHFHVINFSQLNNR